MHLLAETTVICHQQRFTCHVVRIVFYNKEFVKIIEVKDFEINI